MFRFATYIVLALILIILIINVYIFSFSRPYVLNGEISADSLAEKFAEKFSQAKSTAEINAIEVTPTEPFPVAIVLGASVYSDGTLSPVLEARAKTGLDLYQRGLVRKLLVSGDNRRLSYNEVIPIRNYLLAAGVPPEDVFTDFAGFTTYDSLYRARDIFSVQDALIVTQSFHLPRAIFVARKLGLNAYGVPADGGADGGGKGEGGGVIGGADPSNSLREIGASAKTFFEVISGAKPYFLGRQIPITGDGRGSLK